VYYIAQLKRVKNFMRILVTGGAGFLGSHLCENLVLEGHNVIAVDNLYTGTQENLSKILNYPNFQLIRHDVCLPIHLEVDAIYNLACPASPIHYQKHPVQTTRTSVMGAINMLDLAKELEIPILQASTSEVYGDPAISPQHEEYWGNVNPIGIRACYDEGKRLAETLFYDYYRQYDVSIRVARIFNTYGPRMQLDDGRVISNLIVQALQDKPITIYGDGSQTRSFCFYSDLLSGLKLLMNSQGITNTPINLGNPEEYSILELAKLIIKLTNSNSKIQFLSLPMDDPKQRKPSIKKAIELLNWSPSIQIEEGLEYTIQDLAARL
jgi:UDP-glucuronate decarboxylase